MIDAGKEVHVKLRSPMSVRISDRPTEIGSFDGYLVELTEAGIMFKTKFLYKNNTSDTLVQMTAETFVPLSNLASIAAQPFPKDK